MRRAGQKRRSSETHPRLPRGSTLTIRGSTLTRPASTPATDSSGGATMSISSVARLLMPVIPNRHAAAPIRQVLRPARVVRCCRRSTETQDRLQQPAPLVTCGASLRCCSQFGRDSVKGVMSTQLGSPRWILSRPLGACGSTQRHKLPRLWRPHDARYPSTLASELSVAEWPGTE